MSAILLQNFSRAFTASNSVEVFSHIYGFSHISIPTLVKHPISSFVYGSLIGRLYSFFTEMAQEIIPRAYHPYFSLFLALAAVRNLYNGFHRPSIVSVCIHDVSPPDASSNVGEVD